MAPTALVALAAAATAAATAALATEQPHTSSPFPSQPTDVPVFTGSYGTSIEEHHRFGFEIGSRFAHNILEAVDSSVQDGVLSIIKPYLNTTQGRATYEHMLEVHRNIVPLYVEEIRGMANGSGVAFELLFSINVGESLSTIADPYDAKSGNWRRGAIEHCSDYIMWPYEAHNEDGDPGSMRLMTFLNVTIDNASFFAMVYPGQLASGAFGWNSYGTGFTLNYVAPYDADKDGLGRNFISRDLLCARSLKDAIFRATDAFKHATGHNFQLMSFVDHSIVNVEAAPYGRYSVRYFNKSTPPLFHANDYVTLSNVKQYKSPSSLHRLARAKELGTPTTPGAMLKVLGDQADKTQPIFHDRQSYEAGDKSGDATITTMLFDVLGRTAVMYHGNPKNNIVQKTFSV